MSIIYTDQEYNSDIFSIRFWDFCDRNKLHCIQNKVNKPYKFSLKYHFKNMCRAFKVYSFVPLTGGATAAMHIL